MISTHNERRLNTHAQLMGRSVAASSAASSASSSASSYSSSSSPSSFWQTVECFAASHWCRDVIATFWDVHRSSSTLKPLTGFKVILFSFLSSSLWLELSCHSKTQRLTLWMDIDGYRGTELSLCSYFHAPATSTSLHRCCILYIRC